MAKEIYINYRKGPKDNNLYAGVVGETLFKEKDFIDIFQRQFCGNGVSEVRVVYGPGCEEEARAFKKRLQSLLSK